MVKIWLGRIRQKLLLCVGDLDIDILGDILQGELFGNQLADFFIGELGRRPRHGRWGPDDLRFCGVTSAMGVGFPMALFTPRLGVFGRSALRYIPTPIII